MTIIGDGLQRRDFTYVKDVVNANFLAANSNHASGEIINIGTATNYNIVEIAEAIGGDYIFIEPRLGELRESLADNSKAKRLLLWEPKMKLKEWIKKQ